MERRQAISLLGGVAISWPLAAFAQLRIPRVGVLLTGRAVPPRELEIAGELARIGYIDGRNIAYDTGLTDATRGAHRAHALWPRHEQRPHAGGSRQTVLVDARAHSADRGQGTAEAEAAEPIKGAQELPR